MLSIGSIWREYWRNSLLWAVDNKTRTTHVERAQPSLLPTRSTMRIVPFLCLLIIQSARGQEECQSSPEINCSATLTASSGNLSSPCFPADYGGYLRCNILVITDGSTVISVQFISFILNGGDYLTVWIMPILNEVLVWFNYFSKDLRWTHNIFTRNLQSRRFLHSCISPDKE